MVALSVPLVLAIVFIVMYATGIDLHRITLGALIIALGLLVDDAIIAIEMMVVKMEQGFDRAQAATFAWTSTAFPMLTGTLVTAAGFLPVGFANSSTGEYAGGIFWVVALALIASWFVAVLFTPYLGMKLLPDFAKRAAARRAHHDPDAIYDTRIYRTLRRVIEFCLRWRKTVVAATVVMFAVAIAAFGLVQQQFFPTSTRTELFFEMRLPEGSAIGVTDAAAKKAERLLTGDRRYRDLHELCRAGRAALLARAQSGAAERELRADRHRDQGPAGARARQGAAREGARRRRPPGSAHPRRPLRVRSAGRLSGAVPRHRSGSAEGARIRRAGAQGDGGQPQAHRPAPRLGRAVASRSGSRSTRIAPARSA